MRVIKRDGRSEAVHFDKITGRIEKLVYGLNGLVDPVIIAQKVVVGVYDGVTTAHLDELASETAAFMSTIHPDYSKLGGRLAMSNLHKSTHKSFSRVIYDLYTNVDELTKRSKQIIADDVFQIVQTYSDRLDAAIIYYR